MRACTSPTIDTSVAVWLEPLNLGLSGPVPLATTRPIRCLFAFRVALKKVTNHINWLQIVRVRDAF